MAIVEKCRVKVKFAGVLVSFAGSESIDVDLKCGSTLRELLRRLAEVNPKLRRRLIEDDDLWPGVYVAINDTDVRLLNGLNTRLNNGDVILFLSYIHGG